MNKANHMFEKKHEFKSLINVEIKSVNEEGEIEGLGSTFSMTPDAHGDIINPKAFNRTLKSGRQVIMLSRHDPDQVIGRWDIIKKTKDGLHVKGTLNLEIEEARNVHSHLKHGDYKGLSIGFFTEKEHFEDDVRVIDEIKLMEVSITPFPANEEAGVTAVKDQALNGFSKLDVEQQNQILGHINALTMSLSDIDPSNNDNVAVATIKIDATEAKKVMESVKEEILELIKADDEEGHSDQELDNALVDSELLNSIKNLTQDTNKYMDSELLHSIKTLVDVLKDKKENDNRIKNGL